MQRKGMTRKEFLAFTSMGIAGTYLSLHSDALAAMMGGGGMGGGGMTGGTSVIDPPPGAAFRNPAEALRNSNGVYELEAIEQQVNLNGTWARLLTYNGSFPGPTIRTRKGDQLRVLYKNSLPYTTEKNFLGHTRNA